MSLPVKRKHKTLSLVDKNKILKRLERGETLVSLAKEFGVGRATIHDIRKNSEKIKNFCGKNENVKSSRKTLKPGEFPQVEDSLYLWFLQERERHTPISGEILKEKARFFYKKIMNNDDFHASEGWLDKFKRRFGIRILSMTGEKLSCDTDAVEPFKEEFKKAIDEMGLTPDQVYNADESGLFWRLLPNKTYVHRAEASAPGRKLAKDRVTFMPCSNASGTHKMNMLVIGKATKPRAFKNVQLPVDYKAQNKGWMTKSVFVEWFEQLFVPSVKKFLNKQKLPQKALLILDNCPGHPHEEDLNIKDSFIRIMFLPPNVTPILQPMDQNVIQAIKMQYKKSLLYTVLSKDDSVIKSLNQVNLKDVVFSLANAWENLNKKVIVCSWANLWPNMDLLEQYQKKTNETAIDNSDLNQLRDVFNEHLIDTADNVLTNDDVRDWLTGDEGEENQFLSDDEIVDSVSTIEEDCEDGSGGGEVTPAVQTIPHDVAVRSFAASITWAEENGVSARDILVLKRLQENVLKMSFKVKKQSKIDNYFMPSTSKE